MKPGAILLSLSIPILSASASAAVQDKAASEPDYSAWTAIVRKHYDPANGMDYKGLKAADRDTLKTLRDQLSRVSLVTLNPKQRLAYWINVYNINITATIVDRYPVESVRDISTDPLRLNVFKKPFVPFGDETLSFDEIIDEKIRNAFKDPRIHFALVNGAKGCPALRREPYLGKDLDEQLDDQARTILDASMGSRFSRAGDAVVARLPKTMDWFLNDFKTTASGQLDFIRKYVSADKQALLSQAKAVEYVYDEYDWSLNDWKK